MNDFWKNAKTCRNQVCSIITNVQTRYTDVRPYAEIVLLGEKCLGLLDSGAEVSCLGKHMAKKVQNKLYSKNHKISIRTADSTEVVCFGSIELEVLFKNVKQKIIFFVVPNLNQDIILGVDFWKKFNVAPSIISQIDVIESPETPPNTHLLSYDQKSNLEIVKSLFPSYEREGLGKTSLMEYEIELEPHARPIKQRYFPISPAIEKLVHKEVDEMLSLGVIEEAPNCPWSSPVVLIKKPNKVRLCLDSRKVNAVTIKDAYPLPHIDGIISRLPKAEFISSLDLRRAFWQIPLSGKSIDYTCFTVPNRPLYRYTVMPFGLCNAPQALCRLMDHVVPHQLRNEVFVYLDDLLIISESFEKHMKVLSEIAGCLIKAGLTINVSKSKFCLTEVKYLGFVVGNGTLKVDDEKVSAITGYPKPTSVKQLRRFLGMAGWYRRFIENYASITVPLTELLRKGKGFNWNVDAQKSFDELKLRLSTAPVLTNPDYSKPFILQCDASKLGVGAVLAQLDNNGDEAPIAYFSKKLNAAQSNYSVTEQECLAVILSLKKFRPYIEGQDFTVITDHASLKWLMKQTDLSGRLARWALKLQGYRFEILHRKGSENVVPDTLSRQNFDIDALVFYPQIDLDAPEFNSADYRALASKIANEAPKLPDLQLVDGKIYKRLGFDNGEPESSSSNWKLWVPKDLTAEVIEKAHSPPNKCHEGVAKTLARLKANFYWPGMSVDVKKYIADCNICHQTKSSNYVLRPPMKAMYSVSRPFEKLYIDLLGPYPRSKKGNIGMIVVLDHLTKFPLLKAIRNFSTNLIIQYLAEEIFPIFGTPEILMSDNGKQFKNNTIKNLLEGKGVKQVFTAIYSPQANASERVNRSIVMGIRTYIGKDQREWDKHIADIAESLRSSFHQAIGCTPYYALFGQQMATHGGDLRLFRQLSSLEGEHLEKTDKLTLVRNEIKKNIEDAFKASAQRYNLRSREKTLTVGDVVYRRNFVQSSAPKQFTAKFATKFIKGKIIGLRGNSLFEVEDEGTKRVEIFHGKDLKPTKS